MPIVSILMSAATIVLYFFLSLFLPFLAYLIPYYKITRVNLYKKIETVVAVQESIQESMTLVTNYYIFGAFFVVIVSYFFLFLNLIPSTYKLWKISCYWLIPYMLILWAHKYNISSNLLIENNILECIKWMYVLYGIKVMYSLLDRIGVKANIIKHAISMMIGLQFAPFVFILGALVSFEFIEVKEIKI